MSDEIKWTERHPSALGDGTMHDRTVCLMVLGEWGSICRLATRADLDRALDALRLRAEPKGAVMSPEAFAAIENWKLYDKARTERDAAITAKEAAEARVDHWKKHALAHEERATRERDRCNEAEQRETELRASADYWKNVAERENTVDARAIVEWAAKAQREACHTAEIDGFPAATAPLVTLETLPGMAGDPVAPGPVVDAGVPGRGCPLGAPNCTVDHGEE